MSSPWPRFRASDVVRALILCSVLRVRRLPALLSGAALATLSLVGASLPSGAASGAEQIGASQLLATALNAAQKSGSLHFVAKTTVNGTTETLGGEVSAATAGETLTSSSPLQVELIGGLIYVTGNAQTLEQALQISAAQAEPYAGKWIVVQSSDAPFQVLAQDLTISSTIDEFTPARKGLKIGKVRQIGSVKAVPITGSGTNSPKGTSSSVTLFVSPKSPHIPVGGSRTEANKTDRLSEVAVFKDWGAKVVLAAPTGAIPFSTVLG